MKTFNKVKVKKNYLFYIALCYKKMGDGDQANEKLNEAYAITGMSINSFINSQPFLDNKIVELLKNDLKNI